MTSSRKVQEFCGLPFRYTYSHLFHRPHFTYVHEVASLAREVSSVPKCNLASTCDSVKTSFVQCNNFISCLQRFSSKLVNRLSRVDSLVQCTPYGEIHSVWLWWWLPLRLSKCQSMSTTTLILSTILTGTFIHYYRHMIRLLGSNHLRNCPLCLAVSASERKQRLLLLTFISYHASPSRVWTSSITSHCLLSKHVHICIYSYRTSLLVVVFAVSMSLF